MIQPLSPKLNINIDFTFNTIKNIKKIYCELNGKIKYKYLEKQYDYWQVQAHARGTLITRWMEKIEEEMEILFVNIFIL